MVFTLLNVIFAAATPPAKAAKMSEDMRAVNGVSVVERQALDSVRRELSFLKTSLQKCVETIQRLQRVRELGLLETPLQECAERVRREEEALGQAMSSSSGVAQVAAAWGAFGAVSSLSGAYAKFVQRCLNLKEEQRKRYLQFCGEQEKSQ